MSFQRVLASRPGNRIELVFDIYVKDEGALRTFNTIQFEAGQSNTPFNNLLHCCSGQFGAPRSERKGL